MEKEKEEKEKERERGGGEEKGDERGGARHEEERESRHVRDTVDCSPVTHKVRVTVTCIQCVAREHYIST